VGSDADASQTSIAGFHPAGRDFAFDVAPATAQADTSNTLRLRLVARACWRLNKSLFDFASSFIRPEISEDLKRLRSLIKAAGDVRAAIFGHADPTGQDEPNKDLGGRRARAVFALLTRDPDEWEKLFSTPADGDNWGLRSTQIILSHLERPDDTGGGAYYTGAIDGKFGPATDRAVRDFQGDHGLAVDGVAGPDTRRELYTEYMDAVAIAPDDPFVMAPEDFVGEGAQGGKGALQGCGEFNPVLVLSEAQEQKFAQSKDKTVRDRKNAPNRRVVLFLFDKTLLPPLASWPCPLATEGSAGCKAQFFDDADSRRGAGDAEKTYAKTRATMACRFYDRLARASPCEGGVKAQVVAGRILLASGGPAASMPFVVRVDGQVVDGGFTDDAGRYRVEGIAGKAEVALVDRFLMAPTADDPGAQEVAVLARPDDENGEDGDPGDGSDTEVA
jgi:outer membrane protein OmpA-like peptidoglycan-associated protein